MSYLDRIRACRRHDPRRFRPFVVAGSAVGHVKREFAQAIAAAPRVFQVRDDAVRLDDRLRSPADRTAAVADALGRLRDRGDLEPVRGEDFPVVRAWGEAPLLLLDRSVVTRFGVRAFGLHVNGYVRAGDQLELWVGRRSRSAHTAPGKWDHLVAGGQPHGLTLRENLEKEAAEEASLPPALARRAVPVGALAYRMETDVGLKNDTVFLWDLALPAAFTPVNRDGEVEAFERWPVARVMATVRDTDDFKFNVSLALVDFFVRWGLLDPDEDGYLEVLAALHGGADAPSGS
jgi:hypothetical protein